MSYGRRYKLQAASYKLQATRKRKKEKGKEHLCHSRAGALLSGIIYAGTHSIVSVRYSPAIRGNCSAQMGRIAHLHSEAARRVQHTEVLHESSYIHPWRLPQNRKRPSQPSQMAVVRLRMKRCFINTCLTPLLRLAEQSPRMA